MLEALKLKISNDNSPQVILAHLTAPVFVHNLSLSDLKELVKMVEAPTAKLHPKVTAAIYSIIVMKDSKATLLNTKIAIESLTKYYRTLSQAPNPHLTQNSREVIAALLLRIPTFSNFKLVIRDVTPMLVPTSIMLQHNQAIKKQCPNLYDEFVVKRYRHKWVELIVDSSSLYPLDREFESLKNLTVNVAGTEWSAGNTNAIMQLQQYEEQMIKQAEFLQKRISYIKREEVDLQKLCQEIESLFGCILSAGTGRNQEQLYYPTDFLNRKKRLLQMAGQFCLRLVRVLLAKCRSCFARKLSWLSHKVIKPLLLAPYSPVNPRYELIIELLEEMLEIFGLGCYEFSAFVFTQPFSIFHLIEALSYNDYSKNNQQSTQQINYQKREKGKQKNTIHINLQQGALVDTHHQDYLKTTDARQREDLLGKCLDFCIRYYQKKQDATMNQYDHASDILEVLQNSKNKLSDKNRQKVEELKRILYGQFSGQAGSSFQAFCERTFHSQIKKKSTRNLGRQRVTQLIIEPTVPTVQTNSRAPHNGSAIKKTESMDFFEEGWSFDGSAQNKKAAKHEEKSEIFYSIKECSVINASKPTPEQEHNEEFILTPEF